MGYLPQQAGWPGTFTVRELLQYAAWWHRIARGERQEAVDRAIEAFDLGVVIDQQLRSLSGGTRRRVMIAQSIVHEPTFVVLDEPTAGLDIQQRIEVREFLMSFAQDGRTTVVVASHIADDLDRLASWITILERGRVLFDGSRAELGLGTEPGGLERKYLAMTGS